MQNPAGQVVARVWEGNAAAEPIPQGGPWVCWSGWTGDARPEDGWYERTASWLPSAATERERVVSALVGAGAIIRPHARHLISDIPGCLNLLRKHEGVKLLLEPAAMLEPSMMETATDHFDRMLTALGPSVWGVVLSDAVVQEGGDDPWCRPVAPGAGALDIDALRDLVRAHAAAAAIRIVRA